MTSEPESDPTPEAAQNADRELSAAYAHGDFAHLSSRARELAADASAPAALRERAREWSARVSVDVVVYAMLAFALTLFCAIVIRYALP